jgi:hypothetical protein
MKSKLLIVILCIVSAMATHAQTWADLGDEEKLMKLKSFRADNQKYLKDSLKLTQKQMTDLDNINICFLSTLDRIDRYAKDDANKEHLAQVLWEVRWVQVDAVIGKDKHDKYASYLKRKLQKAIEQRQI